MLTGATGFKQIMFGNRMDLDVLFFGPMPVFPKSIAGSFLIHQNFPNRPPTRFQGLDHRVNAVECIRVSIGFDGWAV